VKNTLKDKKVIDKIFKTGKTKSDGVVLIKFIESNKTEVLVTTSSKKFPRAVDRNRIKRLIRESIKDITIVNKAVAIVYIGNIIPTFKDIKNSISKLV
jgi:ribonuclease P protein component